MTARLASTDPTLAAFADDIGHDDPVAIVGAQTRWEVGGLLADGTRLLTAPRGVVDYVPEEMIVTVRAGTPVEELHAELASRGQWTAIPERGGTVGGAVVVGQNDFRRQARGDLRSAVLQVRYVSAEARLVTGGGPTVKNVSGFDLPRLFTGSLGTLGCVAEVIVRTNPIPACIRWFESSDADPFVVQRGLLQPGAVLWNGTTTTVMLHGHPPVVDDDVARLQKWGTFGETDEPETPTGHRWSLTPKELRTLNSAHIGDFVAEIGVGTVHATTPQPARELPASVRTIHDRLKAEFDPRSRLNPGRVVGGR